jgi:hypothetical protein
VTYRIKAPTFHYSLFPIPYSFIPFYFNISAPNLSTVFYSQYLFTKLTTMKKLVLPFLLALFLPGIFSCSALKNYQLTELDAAAAIRQMLELGARDNLGNNAFSKDAILSTLFPEPVKKALNTAQQLGLTDEIDRFTTTLSTAATQTAQRSVPIFVGSINNMTIPDAIRIVKGGGTAATDYLRLNTGDSLRRSVRPIMQTALDEYKLTEQWNKIVKPLQSLTNNKINLDLANLMSGMVSEQMFRKLEEKEKQVRVQAEARTTPLLKKVFSRQWE